MKQKKALTVYLSREMAFIFFISLGTVSQFLKFNFLEWNHNCNFNKTATLTPNSTRVTNTIN